MYTSLSRSDWIHRQTHSLTAITLTMPRGITCTHGCTNKDGSLATHKPGSQRCKWKPSRALAPYFLPVEAAHFLNPGSITVEHGAPGSEVSSSGRVHDQPIAPINSTVGSTFESLPIASLTRINHQLAAPVAGPSAMELTVEATQETKSFTFVCH
jgi:hypothetical protein